MGFGFRVLGFGFWVLGFRVQGEGLGMRDLGGFRGQRWGCLCNWVLEYYTLILFRFWVLVRATCA